MHVQLYKDGRFTNFRNRLGIRFYSQILLLANSYSSYKCTCMRNNVINESLPLLVKNT